MKRIENTSDFSDGKEIKEYIRRNGEGISSEKFRKKIVAIHILKLFFPSFHPCTF